VASASKPAHLPSFQDVVMRIPRSGVAFRLMGLCLSRRALPHPLALDAIRALCEHAGSFTTSGPLRSRASRLT
jgi:hypothetical protein